MARYEGPQNPLYMRADLTRDTLGQTWNNNPGISAPNMTGAPARTTAAANAPTTTSSTFAGQISSTKPIPDTRNIPSSLGALPGNSSITPDEGRETRDEANDQPVVRHIVHKPWIGTPGLAPMEGDKTPYLSHDKQLMPGHLVFTAVPLYEPVKEDGHKIIAGDLAKINTILTERFLFHDAKLKEKGWVLGAPNRTIRSVQGLVFRDIINFIYKRVVSANMTTLGVRVSPDLDEMVASYLKSMSFMNLVEDASMAIEDPPADVVQQSSSESDSDDDSSDAPKSRGSQGTVVRDQRVSMLANRFLAWPSEADVHAVHKRLYRDRDRVNNPYQQYNTQTDDKNVMEAEVLEERKKIQKACEEELSKADFSEYFSHLTTYQNQCLAQLFRMALTEMLGSLDTYTPYCTSAGIRDTWHFWGVFYNAGTGNRPSGDLGPMSSVGNYIIEKNCRIINRWDSELKVNSRLFVYLSKVGDKRHSPFQLLPWNSRPFTDTKTESNKDYPSAHILSFFDRNGNAINAGHAIFIGTVQYNYKDHMDKEKKRIMNGISDPINGSYILSYMDAHENLRALGDNWLNIFVRC